MRSLIITLALLAGSLTSQTPGPSNAEPDISRAIDAVIGEVLPGVIADRRTIHANPELGEREVETAALVAKRLRALGLRVKEKIAKTGVVGILEGGKPGGVVAYRADMDALPIIERTDLPFKSRRLDQWAGKRVGVMHACGHDVHVAVGLGVAAILASPKVRPHVKGTVVFIFQPAEEGVPEPGRHGADLMIAEGVLDDPAPTAVFGLHCSPIHETGTVAISAGGAMAAVDRFTIDVRGRQTHGAYPHSGVDTILVASHIVVAIQSIASRNVDPVQPVVVTVGKIEAGNRFNIIPETAQLVGTIRTHDTKIQDLVHARLERVAQNVAKGFGAAATVTIKRNCPVTYNDPKLLARMRPAFERALGADKLLPAKPQMGGEDFAFFAQKIPGIYYWLGVRNEAKGCTAMIHTPFFKADEDAVKVGMKTSSELLIDYLGR